jgi:hypothetical protein
MENQSFTSQSLSTKWTCLISFAKNVVIQSPYTFKFHRMLPWNHLSFSNFNFLLGNLFQIILVAMHGFHLVNSTHDLHCLSDGRTGWANVKRMGVVDRKAITNAGGLNTSAPCGRPPRTRLNTIHTGFARRRATTDDPSHRNPPHTFPLPRTMQDIDRICLV